MTIYIPSGPDVSIGYTPGERPHVDALIGRIIGRPVDTLPHGTNMRWSVGVPQYMKLARIVRAISRPSSYRPYYDAEARRQRRERGHERARRIAIVRAVWQQHQTARERLRALRAAVPHLHGQALAVELAALVREASGRRGVGEVRARVERLTAYLDPRKRARRRDEARWLRDEPYDAISYSPVVRGRAKRYAAQYRGYRVVKAGRTADGRYSTDVRCEGVRVIWDSGAVYSGGERSQGHRAREFAERLARHRNLLHAVARGKARVTVEDITSEPNEELRRELITAYGGFDRYALDAGGELIHEDDTGRLVRIPAAGEPIAVVHVTCPTTGRQYALRVPPSCTTAREAVAWTFGLRADEYRPSIQS